VTPGKTCIAKNLEVRFFQPLYYTLIEFNWLINHKKALLIIARQQIAGQKLKRDNFCFLVEQPTRILLVLDSVIASELWICCNNLQYNDVYSSLSSFE